MGINSVNGQNLAALFLSARNQRPAPELRRTDAAPELISAQRAEPAGRVEQGVDAASQEVASLNSGMTHSSIRVDKENNRIVVRLLDKDNQVIKQIPPEETLEIASKMRRLQALLFDESV